MEPILIKQEIKEESEKNILIPSKNIKLENNEPYMNSWETDDITIEEHKFNPNLKVY